MNETQKTKKIMAQQQGLRDKISLIQTDPRYIEYKNLEQVLLKGQLLEKELQRKIGFLSSLQEILNKMTEESDESMAVVNNSVLPQKQQRTSEQIENGRFTNKPQQRQQQIKEEEIEQDEVDVEKDYEDIMKDLDLDDVEEI
jgi:hypothetical protein